MKLFYLINAPSNSGRTQRRLCFEKYFPEDVSEEEIEKWIGKLKSFAKPRNYHNPPVDELSKSFQAVEYGYLCGIGNYTVYKFDKESSLFVDIFGVWNESFRLKENAWYFETHSKSGRYYQIFTTIDNIEWLNIGTICRPKYLYPDQILKHHIPIKKRK